MSSEGVSRCRGRQLCVPVAVFGDLKAAFYSVLTEEVVGRLLTTEARQVALACVGLSPAAVAVFEAQAAAGHPTFGLPSWPIGTATFGSPSATPHSDLGLGPQQR